MAVPSPPFQRVLIANRGEIAVRVARACQDLSIGTVAVASEADRHAMHTRVADEVVIIGAPPAAESYLRQDRIIEAAKERGCDAIHPGYGFLSQNADFADAVEVAGVTFIGPPGSAMRLMGDKTSARRAMAEAGVPIVPGYEGSGDEDAATLKQEAVRIGFPLLVKAAAGGGGRGMRIVRDASELDEALSSAGREAEKAFGDGRLFLERFLRGARHVEIQVLADAHGAAIHLLERECSVQRRYQKILEESPSPRIDETLRGEMGAAAVRAALACGYRNAGTVEFLVADDGAFYFLEMNTRLQVEHPVTELVTGVDLVQSQLRVAAGEPLWLRQEEVTGRGHAIECRINAEDPGRDFAPATGPVLLSEFASGPGIRVDTGFETGDEVSIHYDSMIAKLLVHAEDRPSAIRRMRSALSRSALLGVRTNTEFLGAVLQHPVFQAGQATTTFVEDEMSDWRPAEPASGDEAWIAAAVAELARGKAGGAGDGGGTGDGDRYSPWGRADGFRAGD